MSQHQVCHRPSNPIEGQCIIIDMATDSEPTPGRDPIAELEAASVLYEQYLEISGANSPFRLNQLPSYSAPKPGPLSLTFK